MTELFSSVPVYKESCLVFFVVLKLLTAPFSRNICACIHTLSKDAPVMNRVGQVCAGRSTAAQETDPFLLGESGDKAGAGAAGQCQMPGGLQGCRHTHRLHWALRTPAVTRGRQARSRPVCGGAGGGAGREQALWRGERGPPCRSGEVVKDPVSRWASKAVLWRVPWKRRD